MENSTHIKKWEKPEIIIINLKETQSGDWNHSTEGSIWIFTWGS